ncbi:hypothetical protein LIER_38429 [Lithospermum erythrorhizon]|uniref:ATP-dependent DNA helicase n=1 Tax=Lithospermum erythrorhizon TaxID=34254 RepID=A0AAV3Q199_LITER
MPMELHRLFATLLHYCRPSNPQQLFKNYYDYIAEDFKRLQNQLMLSEKSVLHKVLQGINDTLEPLGRDINEYPLVPFTYIATESERYTRKVMAARNIPVPEEDLHAINYLNSQQKEAFDVIFNAAMSGVGGVFFIDGPGGTRKSFLYRVLLAHTRSKGFIGIVVASSGITSSRFLGGRTAHSRFKIPVDADSKFQSQMSSQSSEAELIRNSKLMIWDEAPMADKAAIHVVNKLLQDVCQSELPFGGKLVVFGDDFRQVLPVIRGGGRTEQVNASIVSSALWKHFTKLKLTDNMRAKNYPAFIDFLMRIGNGEEPVNARNEIKIPAPMLIPYTSMEQSIEALISSVYPDLSLFERNPFEIILYPKNDFVDDINSKLIERISGEKMVYISNDRAKNAVDQGDYVDYLNSLEPRGLPQHKSVLKLNCPVILLRNITFEKYKPRRRASRQFPLCLCFAMTINKSQGTKYTANVVYNDVLVKASLP